MKQFFYIALAFLSLLLLGSIASARLDYSPESEIESYFEEINQFFLSKHLVQQDDKRLTQLIFQFKENSHNIDLVEPYINIITIEDVVIIKIIDIPLVQGKLVINPNTERILVKAYLFSEALLNKNKVKSLWGKTTNYQLEVPDAIIMGLLAFKAATNLETKVAAVNNYRAQHKQLKFKDLKLDFSEKITDPNINIQAFTLSSLSFVGTWCNFLMKAKKYPNWSEVVKFRGDWNNYFKEQLPDSKKWMETQSQWLDFRLVNLLKRQPYDKMTLIESEQALVGIWQLSSPLWVDIGAPITDADFKVINYVQKKIGDFQHVVNPYYYPLTTELNNLLVQKWFKSPSLISDKMKSLPADFKLNEEQKNKAEKELDRIEDLSSDELTQELKKLHTAFKQKLAMVNLRANLVQQVMVKENLEAPFIDSDEKKASNQTLNLYKKDPISNYLNQYN